MLENPQVLALCASFLFGLALVLTQFGLRHVPPSRGASISIPTSAVLLSALAPFMLDWDGWDPRGALIFVLVGLLFPATVTLLTFEANRRMGPSVSGALSNLTPLFAVAVAAFLFNEVPRPLQALGIAMIVIGVITLSINRDWLGTRWHLGAILLPIGIAGIRGLTHPITKLGLALWPSPFAAVLIGYLMSSLVVTGVAVTGKYTLPSGDHRAGRLWFGCVGACNGLGVLALYAALAHGPVLLVSPLVATYPLVTLAFAAIRLYDLPDDFDFDHFGNWVPSHSGCNQRKSFTISLPCVASNSGWRRSRVNNASVDVIRHTMRAIRRCPLRTGSCIPDALDVNRDDR